MRNVFSRHFFNHFYVAGIGKIDHYLRMAIEIEYCEQWNYRPEADRVSAEIKSATGQDVTLVGGGGGIFEIRKEGESLWKKERGGEFPAEGEASALFV